MKTTYEWTLLFISIGIIVQTLEYLSLQDLFSEKGIWRWSELRSEYAFLPYFDFCLAEKPFLLLLWLRLIAAIATLFFFSFPVMLILFFTTLLIALRFRGSFNGGSDYMTAIILSALCVGAFFQTEKVLKGVLVYIAFQCILSYFLAGLVKIKQPLWRNGKALSVFIRSPNYSPPEFFKTVFANKKIAFIAAWMVMLAELFFPLVLFVPKELVAFMIAGAFLFHLNNVLLFGLNRFLLAWASTYPAIYFVAKSFSNSP